MSNLKHVAVVGATGAVGVEMLRCLEERAFPVGQLTLLASARSAGKTMKFEHRSAYDDIDSTYEAITAYLDEKGIEAKPMFIEQYLNDVTSADDTSLQVDIYVFVK